MGMHWTIPGHVDCPQFHLSSPIWWRYAMKMCFSLGGLCEDAGNNGPVIRGYDVFSLSNKEPGGWYVIWDNMTLLWRSYNEVESL